MGLNNYSSGYSSEYTPWSLDSWSDFQTSLQASQISGRHRTSSFADHAVKTPRSIDAVMEEFRMNGSDSPYDPDEDLKLNNKYSAALIGMGPSAVYLRQKSWPVPESSPTVPLPALGLADSYRRRNGKRIVSAETATAASIEPLPLISRHQLKVLNSLPNSVLYFLLKKLEQRRGWETAERSSEIMECRFCKNNGERESHYRSHRLRWQGRVVCPVLRAYRCRRCGADGDAAHTLKYCPLTTDDERKDLAARMRSVHSRRRSFQKPSTDAYGDDLVHGNTNIPTGGAIYHQEPLDPIWEALANKLML